MANIRYQTTFYTLDNIQYRVSIIDKSYSGSIISDFLIENFELSYDSASEENYYPIIGSQLSLSIILVENSQRNDNSLFTFLKSMVEQNTQLYYAKIEEFNGTEFVPYWIGNIVQNQSSYANAPIESGLTFQVLANDFGYLTNKPFEQLVELIPDSVTTTVINKTDHGLRNGQAVKFTSLGSKTTINLNVNYFVRVITDNQFAIMYTFEDAMSDVNRITLTGANTPVPNLTYTDFSDYTLNGILQLCNIYQGFDGSDKLDFWNNIYWFENSITAKPNVNILREIRAYLYSFYNFDKDINSITFIDVIRNIIMLFGARVIQSNGRYYIVQLQNYRSSTCLFRNAGTSDTINTRNAVNNTEGISALKILNGSSFSYQRPYTQILLEKPSGKLEENSSKDFISDVRAFNAGNKTIPDDITEINNLSAWYSNGLYTNVNNTIVLTFKTKLKHPENAFEYPPTPTTIISKNVTTFTQKSHGFRIELWEKRAGLLYYLNPLPGNNFEWNATKSSNLLFDYNIKSDFNLTADDNGEYSSAIVLPPLPSVGKFVEINFNAICHIQGNGYANIYARYSIDASCTVLPNGSSKETTIYNASLAVQPFDAIKKDLETPLLKDIDTIDTGKGLMIVDQTGLPTTSWIVGGTSAQRNIYELIIINALALNYRTKQTINGVIRGNYYPHQLLTYDGKQWAIKRATYNAKDNQWNGDWFEVTYNDNDINTATNIANNGNPENQGKIIKNPKPIDGQINDTITNINQNLRLLEKAVLDNKQELIQGLAVANNFDNAIYNFIENLGEAIPYIAKTQQQIENGVSITSIFTTPIKYSLKRGDKLLIIEPKTNFKLEVEVDGDFGVDTTEFYIVSITPTMDIGTALVLFKMERDADQSIKIAH